MRPEDSAARCNAVLPPAAKRQNLLFSATFSNEIKKLADELLNAPQLIEVARRNTAAETVAQSVYKCPQEAKRALLGHIVRSRDLWQVLCFVRTKHGASRLARQLERDGFATSAIHGDKTQAARLEALDAFKQAKLQVLVATDVAARGLDIDDLPLVVNYELPHVAEDDIHRIGRTGRAGASGEAISLVAGDEERYLVDIERLLKKKIEVALIDFDFDAASTVHSAREPRERRSSGERPTARRDERRSQPRERARGESHGESRAERERAREAAYAKNPDQPLPKRPAAASAHSALTKGAASHSRAPHAKARPVAALLMKRPKEPEKV